MNNQFSVANYLLLRLKQLGVDHIFGVPGDFVLGFLNCVLQSDVEFVGTCNELNAAYAADGYARIRGVGAIATTYGVGELSAINGVAGAFAERVPMVVITGSPSTAHFRARPLLHHTLGDYHIPLKIYEHVSVASAHLTSPDTAPAEIDRVLTACLCQRRPVYISIPADVVSMECKRPVEFAFPALTPSHPEALAEALNEAVAMLNAAVTPVVIADAELIRFKLQHEFSKLIEATGFPYVTMMLGKAVLSEHHPQFIGLFEGDWSRDEVQKRVEAADCVLQLGALPTDFNTGGFTTHLEDSRTIRANFRSVQIKHHGYENVYLQDLMSALARSLPWRSPELLDIRAATEACTHRHTQTFEAEANRPLTIQRLFDRVSHLLEP